MHFFVLKTHLLTKFNTQKRVYSFKGVSFEG